MTTTQTKASILIIYTGGTIGMKEDPMEKTLKPFDFNQITEAVPELAKFACKIDSYTFNPLIDSSDVEPSLWISLAELIKEKYEDYDGFVILHGTDTMAYSASALSFMLEGLRKPVIFTGSQLPIGMPRTDGRENLISSVEIAAAKDAKGCSIVNEVCIFFNSELLRGNRSKKIDSAGFDAFSSPNYPPLASAGIQIRYNYPYLMPRSNEELLIHTTLDTSVAIIKVHPGITKHVAEYFLCDPLTRAVILETYGSGNSISQKWFIDIVRKANDMGKILVNVSQCLSGQVNMDIYATGRALKKSGVICGYDSTVESALAKLFVLMGESTDNEEVKSLMDLNMRGEISK